MEIHVDKGREPRVQASLEDVGAIPVVCKTHLSVGDFALVCGGKVLISFERKTWSDLADTIKTSARRENNEKLKGLDTRVIYVIEGRRPATKCGSVTVKAMLAWLDHRVLVDRFHVEYTKDAHDTAMLICRFASSYASSGLDIGCPVDDIYSKKEVSNETRLRNMWCAVKGVTVNNQPRISEKLKLLQYLCLPREEFIDTVSEIRLSARIGVARATKMEDGRHQSDKAVLCSIPGVSSTKADVILEHMGLLKLMIDIPEGSISEIKVGGRRLGVLENKIRDYLALCN